MYPGISVLSKSQITAMIVCLNKFWDMAAPPSAAQEIECPKPHPIRTFPVPALGIGAWSSSQFKQGPAGVRYPQCTSGVPGWGKRAAGRRRDGVRGAGGGASSKYSVHRVR